MKLYSITSILEDVRKEMSLVEEESKDFYFDFNKFDRDLKRINAWRINLPTVIGDKEFHCLIGCSVKLGGPIRTGDLTIYVAPHKCKVEYPKDGKDYTLRNVKNIVWCFKVEYSKMFKRQRHSYYRAGSKSEVYLLDKTSPSLFNSSTSSSKVNKSGFLRLLKEYGLTQEQIDEMYRRISAKLKDIEKLLSSYEFNGIRNAYGNKNSDSDNTLTYRGD